MEISACNYYHMHDYEQSFWTVENRKSQLKTKVASYEHKTHKRTLL